MVQTGNTHFQTSGKDGDGERLEKGAPHFRHAKISDRKNLSRKLTSVTIQHEQQTATKPPLNVTMNPMNNNAHDILDLESILLGDTGPYGANLLPLYHLPPHVFTNTDNLPPPHSIPPVSPYHPSPPSYMTTPSPPSLNPSPPHGTSSDDAHEGGLKRDDPLKNKKRRKKEDSIIL